MADVRDELLRIFEAMREIREGEEGKMVGARVQGLLRCAAAHLGVEPLPGISLGGGMGRLTPACKGCPGCAGRPASVDGVVLPEGMTPFEEQNFLLASREK